MIKEYDTLDATGWFPNLCTLTIQVTGPGYPRPRWALPFLSSLRPKHIRITHIRGLGNTGLPFILDSPLGSLVEKVTVHFVDCDINVAVVAKSLRVIWPASLKHLDLVFLAPTTDPRTGSTSSVPLHDFTHTRPPHIPKFVPVVRAIVAILMSVEKLNPKLRIIGMCPDETENVGSVRVAGLEAERGKVEAAMFLRGVRAEYAAKLSHGVLGSGENKRVDELEFVTMEEYEQDREYAPFA